MTDKLLITSRGDSEMMRADKLESDNGLQVEQMLDGKALVEAVGQSRIAELQLKGYRVKRLKDVNVLRIGATQIDIEAGEPTTDIELDIPAEQKADWTHFLVQFVSYPEPDWYSELEKRGIAVVEPIPPYGAFIVGSADVMQSLEELPYVAWTGEFKPAYRLAPNTTELSGRVQYINLVAYPSGDGADVISEIRNLISSLNGTVVSEDESRVGSIDSSVVLTIEIDASALVELAKYPHVRWIEFAPPVETEDERSCQVVAEELNGTPPPNTGPELGYQDTLDDVGLTGSGVTIGVCDSGVDSHDNSTMHSDLAGRMDFFDDQSGGSVTTDTSGHGTHVAGIALGNGNTGDVDPQGFLLGQGVAPEARFGSVNPIGTGASSNVSTWVQAMSTNGADVMNNSWGAGSGGSGYTTRARTVDQLVRDPNTGTADLEQLAMVFSAGNRGGRVSSLTDPKEAKNSIVVGNSLNSRPNELFPSDDIRSINGSSSRGPAIDGRILPTVVAPGTNIVAARSTVDTNSALPGTQRPLDAYTDSAGNSYDNYTALTGTSMAAPHVSGLCALLIQWWRERTGGETPSAAMLKALLINGAEDCAGGENWRRLLSLPAATIRTLGALQTLLGLGGAPFSPTRVVEQADDGFSVLTPVGVAANVQNPGDWAYDGTTDTVTFIPIGTAFPGNRYLIYLVDDTQPLAAIPNNDQGWGRVSLSNSVLQAPDSDRGPKLFMDQRQAFTSIGQEYQVNVAPADSARPLRITLTWTDAAAGTGSIPALVNDLDLEVTELLTGNVYKGNVFNNGFSFADPANPADTFDSLNNVECVYLLSPAGSYEIRVIASNLMASARPDIATPWQDFALVIDNAQVPAGSPVNVITVLDRSGSMQSSGYVYTTRTASKQFIDSMNISDAIGVVSFGDDGVVEYDNGESPAAVAPITSNTVKSAANTSIDNIAFGGCTYMGDGILQAHDLLVGAAGDSALVLFSDGYDNKGCAPSDASRPSAIQAAGMLPADVPMYTCAMGPASDQDLLEQLADSTNGRYYFMPTIDDLYEIYNYVRGQVTGTGVILNETTIASKSRVSGLVDALSDEVTFTVAWGDHSLRYVPNDPRRNRDINIRLREPGGKLLPNNSASIQKVIGRGYVVFKIQEPRSGRWYVEVETARDKHTRCTVGGFVQSRIQFQLPELRQRVARGTNLRIAAQMFDGNEPITGFRAGSRLLAPTAPIADLFKKFDRQLRDIKIDPVAARDVDPRVLKLNILRQQMLASKKVDIFASTVTKLSARELKIGELGKHAIRNLFKSSALGQFPDLQAGNGSPLSRIGAQPSVGAFKSEFRTSLGFFRTADNNPAIGNRDRFKGPNDKLGSGVLFIQSPQIQVAGSHNVVVSTMGIAPQTKTRFERKQLVSMLVV